jgi:hypothetical protein
MFEASPLPQTSDWLFLTLPGAILKKKTNRKTIGYER